MNQKFRAIRGEPGQSFRFQLEPGEFPPVIRDHPILVVTDHWRKFTGFKLEPDRKSTRLNSSHSQISYAVFCLKKKTYIHTRCPPLSYLLACYSGARGCTVSLPMLAPPTSSSKVSFLPNFFASCRD